jgi:hypothetical protein
LWSFKGSFYIGYGGSLTVGRENGNWFIRGGAGVGIGGGIKFYPLGGFPITADCGGSPRGFIGPSANVGVSVGPVSVEAKAEAGLVVTKTKDGRPKACYAEQGSVQQSIKGQSGTGLTIGGGLNLVDVGVLF